MALLAPLRTGSGMERRGAPRQTGGHNGVCSMRLKHVWFIQNGRMAFYEAQD